MQAAVDNANGLFRLVLPFDTTQVYDELLTAMTAPNCTIALEVGYSHPYQTRVIQTAPAPAVTLPPSPPPIVRDHRDIGEVPSDSA